MTFEQRTFGNYGVCCRSYPLPYTMKDKSIEDHFNSDEMKAIRSEMESGEPGPFVSKYCEKCIAHEKSGVTSRRQHRINQLEDAPQSFRDRVNDIIHQSEQSVHLFIQNMAFYSLEFKFFGNLCNLKCMMCHPHQSSSLAAEWKKQGKWDGPTHINSYNDIQSEDFYRDMDIMIPNSLELKFTGGEPLMNRDILDLLQYCVDKKYAKNIKLIIITNGTKLPKEFLNILNYFKEITINVSLDGVFEVNDYQRVGSSFDVIDRHINQLIRFPNVKVQVTAAVTAINVGRIHQVVKYAERKNIYADISSIVLKPKHLSVSVLPRRIRDIYIEKNKGLTEVISALDHDDVESEKLLPAFIQTLRNKDARDGTNFIDIIPELEHELRETIDIRTLHSADSYLRSHQASQSDIEI